MATPSTHRNPYWAALRWNTHDLGPQLHSLKTKVCSLDSLWGPVERYLGVCCLLYLLNLSSSLHLRALTCSDLGCTVEAGPTHSSSAPLPAPAWPAGIDFLGTVLPLATPSQNQPPKTCSRLGARLQLARTTTGWPETLAYPLQPYSTHTSDTGRKSSFPLAWGELILPFLLRPRARRGAPTPLSGTQTHTLCHQPSPHNSCLGSAPFITVIKHPPPYHLMLLPLSPAVGETVTPRCP